VVFLNNDSWVQTGWLEALLAAVQPRLLKLDGTVQCPAADYWLGGP
jgi:hypothetical protein